MSRNRHRKGRSRSSYVVHRPRIYEQQRDEVMTHEENSLLEIPFLRRILEVQSVSRDTKDMEAFLADVCEELGAKVYVENGNVYATKGDTRWFPCVVAHSDTVHRIIPYDEYRVGFGKGKYFAYNPKTKKQVGVGGDDKCGIYVALAALRDHTAMKVAFFRDEEIGCQGSRLADKSFFVDVAYVLQADRRGYGDMVNSIGGRQLMSKAFTNLIRPIMDDFHYKFTGGMMTDVEALKDIVPVSMFNMSCGYYFPHSSTEYIELTELELCRALIYRVIRELPSRRYDHETRKRWTNSYHNDGYQGIYSNNYQNRERTAGTQTINPKWGQREFGVDARWKNTSNARDGGESVDLLDQYGKPTIINIIERFPETTRALPYRVGEYNVNDLYEGYEDWDDVTPRMNRKALYEVNGIFKVYVDADAGEDVGLPEHMTFDMHKDDINTCTVSLVLGTKEFHTQREAKAWGTGEMTMLSRKYPQLQVDGIEVFYVSEANDDSKPPY